MFAYSESRNEFIFIAYGYYILRFNGIWIWRILFKMKPSAFPHVTQFMYFIALSIYELNA